MEGAGIGTGVTSGEPVRSNPMFGNGATGAEGLFSALTCRGLLCGGISGSGTGVTLGGGSTSMTMGAGGATCLVSCIGVCLSSMTC